MSGTAEKAALRFEVYAGLLDAADIVGGVDEEQVRDLVHKLMYEFSADAGLLAEAVGSWVEVARSSGSAPAAMPTSDQLGSVVAALRAERLAASSPRGENLTELAVQLRKARRDHRIWTELSKAPRHKHAHRRGMPVRCEDDCPARKWREEFRRGNAVWLRKIDDLTRKLSQGRSFSRPCYCDGSGMIGNPETGFAPCHKCRPLQAKHWDQCGRLGRSPKDCRCREEMAYGART